MSILEEININLITQSSFLDNGHEYWSRLYSVAKVIRLHWESIGIIWSKL